MIGYRNESLKRIGVSKHRLMAGKSKNCVICDKTLRRPPDGSHKCADHSDWELVVVDGSNAIAIAHLLGHEKDSEAV